MLRNFFTIALRTLSRQKLYSTINILGFAIGIAACILILLYIRNELSYDRYHEKADRTYRLHVEGFVGGQEMRLANSSGPVAPTLQRDYPFVEAFTRIRNIGYPVVRYADKTFSEEKWFYVDSCFFDVFSVRVLAGDLGSALTQPNTVVLTESMARKYFGDENPVGQTINTDNRRDFVVTAVIGDPPPNTHFHYDFLVSILTFPHIADNPHWLNEAYYSYIVLSEGTAPEELSSKFTEVLRKYIGPLIQQFTGMTFEQFVESDIKYSYRLQPLTDIHLHSNLEGELEPGSDIRYVRIFGIIALFILLIACINFMNLSTARSAKRAREVGIRKTVGSRQSQLIWQFLSESILVTLIAVAIAMLLVKLTLPGFNRIIGLQLRINYFDNLLTLPILLLFGIGIGTLAGIYPAFFLSSFRPLKVLKAETSTKDRKSWLRNSLVVFQFTITILLISATLLISQQLHYMQNKKLGYNKEQLLIVEKTDDLGRNQIRPFIHRLLEHPGIINVSNSTTIPGREPGHNGHTQEDKTPDAIISPAIFWVDDQFASTYEMEMLQGRFLSGEFATDSAAVVLNEAYARALGWDDPVGRRIFALTGEEPEPFHVIGVVKDFHFAALSNSITPAALKLCDWAGRCTSVRVRTEDLESTIQYIKEQWIEISKGQPFEYTFFDEDFARLYAGERRTRTIITLFSSLAIFIACLGLLGLASFATEQRTKEIGIRKALGASSANICLLLYRDSIQLVLIACLIALPISYFTLSNWLQNYAYRIDYSFLGFGLAASVGLLIAITTVTWQAIRAATANPVDALKYE